MQVAYLGPTTAVRVAFSKGCLLSDGLPVVKYSHQDLEWWKKRNGASVGEFTFCLQLATTQHVCPFSFPPFPYQYTPAHIPSITCPIHVPS